MPDSLSVENQNKIFTTQLQSLTRYFCNIENNDIREYAINLIKEISHISDAAKAQAYCDDMLN